MAEMFIAVMGDEARQVSHLMTEVPSLVVNAEAVCVFKAEAPDGSYVLSPFIDEIDYWIKGKNTGPCRVSMIDIDKN